MKLLIGGSPCTHWSIAKNNRETEPSGIGWELFKNFLIAKEKFRPDYFLYENNKSAAQPIKDQIAKEFGVTERSIFSQDNGVRMTYINSALVSAQNRQRFYVTNFGEIEQPEDRGVFLKDILESGLTYQDKSYCLTANYTGAYPADLFKGVRSQILEPDENGYEVKDGCITIGGYTRQRKSDVVKVNGIPDGKYRLRPFTKNEMCDLQTMPHGYVDCVSWGMAAKGLGNGWTAEVIIHLLNHALKDVPRNEPITVLSMYDGIGTGRYCLDKMGFKHVRYHAYEIDKYAMQISASNYPGIVQHGDAFAVREDDWKIESNKIP